MHKVDEYRSFRKRQGSIVGGSGAFHQALMFGSIVKQCRKGRNIGFNNRVKSWSNDKYGRRSGDTLHDDGWHLNIGLDTLVRQNTSTIDVDFITY